MRLAQTGALPVVQASAVGICIGQVPARTAGLTVHEHGQCRYLSTLSSAEWGFNPFIGQRYFLLDRARWSAYSRRVNYELRQHGGGQDGRVALKGEIFMNCTAGYLDDRHPALQYDVRVRLREAATARRFPVRNAKEMCHSTKRTHRFCLGKQGLSNSVPKGYTIKCCWKTVGSFWKTNPPGGCFGAPELAFWGKRTQTNLIGKTVCIHLS